MKLCTFFLSFILLAINADTPYKAELEVKRFVKEQCGANKRDDKRKHISKPCDIYPELFIKFVGGKPPVITFTDPEESVDLSTFQNEEIHDLLKSKGFERVEAPKEEETEETEEAKAAKADEPKINKQDVLDKLKNLKNPFGGKMFDKMKKVSEKIQKNIPASSEPEYESPTADESSIRSNKRTESLAPDPEENKAEL